MTVDGRAGYARYPTAIVSSNRLCAETSRPRHVDNALQLYRGPQPPLDSRAIEMPHRSRRQPLSLLRRNKIGSVHDEPPVNQDGCCNIVWSILHCTLVCEFLLISTLVCFTTSISRITLTRNYVMLVPEFRFKKSFIFHCRSSKILEKTHLFFLLFLKMCLKIMSAKER